MLISMVIDRKGNNSAPLLLVDDDVTCCKNAAILLILLIPALFTENLEIFFAEDHQQTMLYPLSTVCTGQGGPVYDSIASLFDVHRQTHTQTDRRPTLLYI